MLVTMPVVLMGDAAEISLLKNPMASALKIEAATPVEAAALIQGACGTDCVPAVAHSWTTEAISLGMSAPLAAEMVLSSDLNAASLLTWEEALARSSETCD